MWAGDKSSPPPQYGSHHFGLGEGLVPFRFLAQEPLFQSHRIPFDKRQSLIWKGLAKTKQGLNKGQNPGNLPQSLGAPLSSQVGQPWKGRPGSPGSAGISLAYGTLSCPR